MSIKGLVAEMVLTDLTQRYFEATRARAAMSLLDGYRESSDYEGLAWLLRHHDEETITDDETWDRDAVDDLLHYYSILEVALIAGLLKELPTGVAGLAAEDLGDLIIRIYYEDNYPLTLPSLLRLRLRGELAIVDDAAVNAYVLFARFISVNQLIDNDHEVDDFLWLIDGGEIGNSDISDVFKVLKHPDDITETLLTRPTQRTRLDGAIHGFRTFIDFALQLDDLLKDCGRHRVLAAAFWHHHSYWFRRLNQMFGRRVPKALERMVSWKIEDATMRRTLEREVRRTQAALERLSSGRYGRPLERFVSH